MKTTSMPFKDVRGQASIRHVISAEDFQNVKAASDRSPIPLTARMWYVTATLCKDLLRGHAGISTMCYYCTTYLLFLAYTAMQID